MFNQGADNFAALSDGPRSLSSWGIFTQQQQQQKLLIDDTEQRSSFVQGIRFLIEQVDTPISAK